MLLEFKVENFRSIKSEITLNLTASTDRANPANLIHETDYAPTLLKTVAIYGANASGKTNLVRSIQLLSKLVMTSHTYQKDQPLPFSPFKLDPACSTAPTTFNIIFVNNGIKYAYELSFDRQKILEEKLYHYPNNKKATIFERTKTNNYKFTTDEREQKTFSERTLDNVLYLSKSTQENYSKTADAFDWLTKKLAVITTDTHDAVLSDFTVRLVAKDPAIKETILKALLEADLGIEDFSTEYKKFTAGDMKNVPPEILELIFKKAGEIEAYQIRTKHAGITFDFESEESAGTKRMFSLIGPWLYTLKNGGTLVVDELDTKLHHMLNLFLIGLFHDSRQNKKNAQMIFTTHNVKLLDQNLFRRDQIRLTERNTKTGNTSLVSLDEYHPRKDKDIEKGYLAGRYGALPFIKGDKILK